MAAINEITGQHLNEKSSTIEPSPGKESQNATLSIENIRDAVIITDADYNITAWNKGAEEIYGFSTEEVLGKWVGHIVQTQFSTDEERSQWQRALENNSYWQGEVVQKGKDKEDKYILASISHIKNEPGNVISTVAVNRNITERKRTEQDLKSVKDQLELTFRHGPDAIYLFDRSGKILFLNEKAARLMGYASAEEALKEKIHQNLINRTSENFEVRNDRYEVIDFQETPASITMRTGRSSELIHQSINKKNATPCGCCQKQNPYLMKREI